MASLSGLTLELLAERLAIIRLPPDADVPQLPLSGSLLSLTVTRDEISIVCPEDAAPEGAESAFGMARAARRGRARLRPDWDHGLVDRRARGGGRERVRALNLHD